MRSMGHPDFSYRPWSEERKRAASEREKARIEALRPDKCWGCISKSACPFRYCRERKSRPMWFT